MRVLIDTHALIWAATEPGRLTAKAVAAILEERNELMVSAATAWEIATKVRLGRLPEAAGLETNLIDRLGDAGYTLRAITVEDGLRAGRLVGEHQEPFDRMIAAQALSEDIPVISVDTKLDGFGVRRIW